MMAKYSMKLALYAFVTSSCAGAIAQPGHASRICSDLARLACAAGTFNDGTGEAQLGESLGIELLNKLNFRQFVPQVLEQLRSSQETNRSFRDTALAGTGLDADPQCEDPASTDACDEKLAVAVIDAVFRQITPGAFAQLGTDETTEDESKRGILKGLRDIDYLVLDPVYKRLQESIYEKLEQGFSREESARIIENEIFPKVKSQLLNLIKNLEIPENQKTIMVPALSKSGLAIRS